MQPSLDEGVIEHGVVLAPCHKPVACQIREDGSRAIRSIQAQEGLPSWEAVRSKIGADGLDRTTHFLAIPPVPTVAETAEPLMAVGLQDSRAGTDQLTPCAYGVGRGMELSQESRRLGSMICKRQGALAGRFTGPVGDQDPP